MRDFLALVGVVFCMGAGAYLKNADTAAIPHIRQDLPPERVLVETRTHGDLIGFAWSDGTRTIENVVTGEVRRVDPCTFNNLCCWTQPCGTCCCLACGPPQCSCFDDPPDIKGG